MANVIKHAPAANKKFDINNWTLWMEGCTA